MEILIAVPTFETIYPDTYKSIWDLDAAGNDLHFEYVRGYDCATARNKIARLALDLNPAYVLMVDNDVVLPKDALTNMLEDVKDVCLGFYAHRGPDNVYTGNTNICRLYDADGQKYTSYPLESEYTGEEMREMREKGQYKVRVHGGGLGCALIRTGVFKNLKYPWFDWVNYKTGRMLGEDLFFCEQCKRNGIAVFTDTRVNCGHMLRHVQFAD